MSYRGPIVPAALRKDIDDCIYLNDARERYMSLSYILRNRFTAPDMEGAEERIPILITDAMKAHEEAGRALFRIAERHK